MKDKEKKNSVIIQYNPRDGFLQSRNSIKEIEENSGYNTNSVMKSVLCKTQFYKWYMWFYKDSEVYKRLFD